MPDICLIQASHVIPDAEVVAALPALGKYAKLVTDTYALEPVQLSFMQLDDFLAGKASGAWPHFLNRHSTDPGALGFHDTQDGVPYGRSFSGDDELDGLSPWVTITHELAEMIGNPFVKIFVTLRDGSITIRELCDAVESDTQAIPIDGIPCSNFVFPNFWVDTVAYAPGTKFDYQGRLTGPCPTLTAGGYAEIMRPGQPWSQITDRRAMPGARTSTRADRHLAAHRFAQMSAAMPQTT